MTRMKEKYVKEVAPALMEKFQYKSPMQIPKIEKIDTCEKELDRKYSFIPFTNDFESIG